MGNLQVNAILLIILFLSLVTLKNFQLVYNHDINVVHNSSVGGCIVSERRALMLFKASLVDGANRLLSWVGDDCCNWDGITCNNLTAHVVKLDLRNPIQPHETYYPLSNDFIDYTNYCLRGDINPSLCDLEHLIYLDLSSNDFSRTQIPKCFGSLRNLRYLNLSATGFVKEIPAHLGNLSKLEHLDIGQSLFGWAYNSLTAKNLEWVATLFSLKSLDLSGINLSECVDWLDSVNMVPSLSSLTLRNCELPAPGKLDFPLLPSQFNLTSLISLDIGGNNLYNSASLFNFFKLLTDRLQVLKLDSNNFIGPIPFLVQKLTSLTVLDISANAFNSPLLLISLCNNHSSLSFVDLGSNQLEGSLPVCLGNLTSVKVFDLGHNNLGGMIPGELGHLKQLTYLDLSFNDFHSSIPSSFGELRELEFLLLGSNKLYGTVSSALGQLTKLQKLDISNNQLFGTIPSTLGQLSKLQKFDISYNQLYGTVPLTLGQLSKLQELDVSYNQLTGEISELHFKKLKRLEILQLSNNQFLTFNIGPQWIPPFQLSVVGLDRVYMGNQFPSWLYSQKNVLELYMSNVNISADSIPEWFWTTFSRVQRLDLSMNYGLMPSSTKNMKSLISLDLSRNKFNGTLPEWIGELTQLTQLCLQSNDFHGMFPSSMKNLKGLAYLDLSENQFNGVIPEWIGKDLSLLQVLRLQSNNFCGVIPPSLKNLKYLFYLDLSQNHFTGSLIEWIGEKLSGLGTLYLQSNNFSGNIPIQLCQLPNLSRLRLANNNLIGCIPDCFDH